MPLTISRSSRDSHKVAPLFMPNNIELRFDHHRDQYQENACAATDARLAKAFAFESMHTADWEIGSLKPIFFFLPLLSP